MLRAQASLLGPTRPAPLADYAIAWFVSVTLHAVAVGLLLPRAARILPTESAPLEVELVQQQAETKGAPEPRPPTPDPAPPAASGAPSPVPPLPQDPSAPVSTAGASGAAPSAADRAAPAAPRSEVNLGDSLRDLDPLTVTGTHIVPPAPDARYRNQPPHYPPAAARIGAEGTVQLLIHIGVTGVPTGSEITSSSGNAELDREAQRAVMLWHFNPARQGGTPVPYDYAINIRFALGNR